MISRHTPKTIVYQYCLKATRDDKGDLSWASNTSLIDKLFLGFLWEPILSAYNNRAKFYYGFSVSGRGDTPFATIDAKIESSKSSLTAPEFLLEIAVIPSKCSAEHRAYLLELLTVTIDDDYFKVWWEDDRRGPRKRRVKDKKKILEDITNISSYGGEDDLKLEDVEVSISEALIYFGFLANANRKDTRKEFKLKYRKLQLEHHPDTETGSEENFLFLQKCHRILTKWLR